MKVEGIIFVVHVVVLAAPGTRTELTKKIRIALLRFEDEDEHLLLLYITAP